MDRQNDNAHDEAFLGAKIIYEKIIKTMFWHENNTHTRKICFFHLYNALVYINALFNNNGITIIIIYNPTKQFVWCKIEKH